MKSRFAAIFAVVLSLLTMTSVSAMQATAVPAAGTITVSATGTATAPAESVMVVITVGPDMAIMPVKPMTAEENSSTAVARAGSLDPTPVVEALVTAGVPLESIEIVPQPFTGDWGPGIGSMPVSLIFSMQNPDVDQLSNLLAVSRESASANGWFINQFNVMYQVENCASIEREARSNAVANARISAEGQAVAMNTTIGSPVGSRDNATFATMGLPTTGCGMTAANPQTPRMYLATMFDPSLPAEVSVTVWLEVTFSIP